MEKNKIDETYELLVNGNESLDYLLSDINLRNSKELFRKLLNSDIALRRVVLEYAGDEIRDDKNLVAEYCKKNYENFEFASERLKNDREYTKELVGVCPFIIRFSKYSGDKEIALRAILKDHNVVMKVDISLGVGFIFKAAELSKTFNFNSDRMDDRAYVLEMVKTNGQFLIFASEKLQNDKEIVLEACKKNYLSFEYASKKLKGDRDYVKKIVTMKPLAIKFSEYTDDKEIALIAVSHNGLALAFVSDRLKNDDDVVRTAITQNGLALQYANPRFKTQKEYLIQSLRNNNAYYYKMLEQDYKFCKNLLTDKDVLNAAINANKLFKYLYKKYYQNYLESKKDKNKHNNYDFIQECLTNKNIILNLFFPNGISDDVEMELSRLARLCDKEVNRKLNIILREVNIFYRNKNVRIYNEIVVNKNDDKKLANVLKQNGLNEKNIYNFIINNRYLDKQMKETLYLIIEAYYGKAITLLDIIDLIDKMLDNKLSLDEMFRDNIVLKEKVISKKLFYKIYNDAYENNPFLYEYIKSSLDENRRRGFKKLLKLGNIILSSPINSLKEYNDLSPKYSPQKILLSLKGTDLYPRLLEKFKNISDIDLETFNNKKGK